VTTKFCGGPRSIVAVDARFPSLKYRDFARSVVASRSVLALAAAMSLFLLGQTAEAAVSEISGSSLPPGSIIRFRDPSLWELYRWPLVTSLLITLQVVCIGWLMVEHRRRCRAEWEVGQRLQEVRTQLVTITHLDRRAAMGEVTAAITHELNQPLEAILHNAEAGEMILESEGPSNEELRHIFADIRRIDMRAAEIIQRLRGLLKKKELETHPIDVNELVRETAALVTPVAGSKGVRVELDLAPDLVPMVGDRIHLQQVLLNMLLNGIEAMIATPRERRRIMVTTVKHDRQQKIAVRDWGHGISAEIVSRIFEPFYTTKGEGMGIGLSIARTIIEAHGGRIAAQNNADGGATIWFTIPLPDSTDDRLNPTGAGKLSLSFST
jgi:signal transduction histidine kinase